MTGTTTVYFVGSGGLEHYGENWQSVAKAIRKLDTIDMDEKVKSDVVADAEHYYSNQSRQFFADCGIPYRRGYLFYGPPGTGKSSFSVALAGHLGCDIYHINLVGITDSKLHRLFLGLPRKCIVVIEDIDSAGIGREVDQEDGDPEIVPMDLDFHLNPTKALPRKAVSQQKNTVTLSGLLNAIDGNASQEGRLLIMTSNKPHTLDAALTRPGRIDKVVKFGNMTELAAQSIFKRLIGRYTLAHEKTLTMEEIEKCAIEFAQKVPEGVFSPAQIQNFLQDCRGDPHKALAEIDVWIKENQPTPGDTAPININGK